MKYMDSCCTCHGKGVTKVLTSDDSEDFTITCWEWNSLISYDENSALVQQFMQTTMHLFLSTRFPLLLGRQGTWNRKPARYTYMWSAEGIKLKISWSWVQGPFHMGTCAIHIYCYSLYVIIQIIIINSKFYLSVWNPSNLAHTCST